MKNKNPLPIVAIVGRPNVGKSRLFNRFVGKRAAIVENTPGVTRDRNYAKVTWDDKPFILIDTGGFEPDSSDELLDQMRLQALCAVEEAEIIIFLVDARTGLLPADFLIADILRKSSKTTILVINKVDQYKLIHLTYEFYELAFEEMIHISAEHGLNFEELADRITRDFPKETQQSLQCSTPKNYFDESQKDDDVVFFDSREPQEAQDDEYANQYSAIDDPIESNTSYTLDENALLNDTISIAVLGKPNTGKSTLINKLLGYQRLLTADIAGTTRDSIDTELTDIDGQNYILIDTAGIRRKKTITHRIEKFSIIKALDAIERADIAILVIDATVGLTDQDQKIAALALEKSCALAILLNKWDLIDDKNDQTATKTIKELREKLTFCSHVPIFTISALTGQRTHKILSTAKKLYINASMRIPTAELNRVFQRILTQHSPPVVGSRTLKFYFIQQVSVRPPTFVIQLNAPNLIPNDYKRYISNQLRGYYKFVGSDLKIIYKKPSGRRSYKDK